MQVYGDGIQDQAKCPLYHRWLHFRGVRKAGFHCIRVFAAILVHVSYLRVGQNNSIVLFAF